MIRLLSHGLIGLGLIALSATSAAADAAYRFIDLGTLPGDVGSFPMGINNQGQVVGGSIGPRREGVATTSFVYSGGRMAALSRDPNDGIVATGIDDRGGIIGLANRSGAGIRGFDYRGGDVDLLTVSPARSNASGQIAGNSKNLPVLVDRDGSIREVGLPGQQLGEATGINSAGQVVGYSSPQDSYSVPFRAFLFDGKESRDLGSLGHGYSRPAAINDRGQVVGSASVTPYNGVSYNSHAFSYRDGLMSDLGTLGGRDSSATAINASGDIVGISSTLNGPAHAFLYRNGAMFDLHQLAGPPPGYILLTATGINDAGQIVGTALTPEVTWRAYLLTPTGYTPPTTPIFDQPIPEPTTLALVVLVAGLLGGRAALCRLGRLGGRRWPGRPAPGRPVEDAAFGR